MNEPHMIEQVIRYSDGTEKVISYRGKIVNGVLSEDKPEKDPEAVPAEETAEVQAPAEAEAEVAPEQAD